MKKLSSFSDESLPGSHPKNIAARQTSPEGTQPAGVLRQRDILSPVLTPLLVMQRKPVQGRNRNNSLDRSRRLPSWLVSLVLHLGLLLFLALLPIAERGGGPLSLFMGETADEGVEFSLEGFQNLELESPSESLDEAKVEAALEVSESKLEEIAELFQTDIQPALVATEMTVSRMLSGRLSGNRSSLLQSGGGSAETEAAVELGLQWLARNQLSSGGWSLKSSYSDGANQENQTAATAMALNAFLGAGYTHREGKYADRVDRGIQFLVNHQNSEGFFATGEPAHHQAYSQAMASISLLEAYGLTGDPKLQGPAILAIRYAEMAQSKLKGWRYEPRTDADVSVTGWFVMALATAKMVGLEINDRKLESVNDYLDSVASRGMSAYAYKERHGPDLTMTAEALLCRILLGWSKTTPGLRKGIEELVQNVPDQSAPIHSVYFWYYATQVLHHYGGDEWELWNAHMKKALPSMQVIRGQEAGSWGPERDMYGSVGGRLYTTCLNIYCLEVYYRHLAVYSVK